MKNLSTRLSLSLLLLIASSAFAGSQVQDVSNNERKISSTEPKETYTERMQQIKLRKYLNRRIGRLEDR